MVKKAYVYRGALATPPPIKMSLLDWLRSDELSATATVNDRSL